MMIIVRHACLAHGVPLHRAPSLPSAGLMLMYCIVIIIFIIVIIIIFVIIINIIIIIIIIIIVSILHIAIIIPFHRHSLGQFVTNVTILIDITKSIPLLSHHPKMLFKMSPDRMEFKHNASHWDDHSTPFVLLARQVKKQMLIYCWGHVDGCWYQYWLRCFCWC